MKHYAQIPNRGSLPLLKNEDGASNFVNPYPKNSERARLENKFSDFMKEELTLASLVSYVGNKNVPLLRLYKFKEAFSFDLVRKFIDKFQLSKEDCLLDPFSGMGTTLFTSMFFDIPSIGVDKLPIAYFVSKTLPLFLFVEEGELLSLFNRLKEKVNKMKPAEIAMDVPIIKVAFNKNSLLMLRRWKSAIETLDYPYRDIFLLLLFSVLEQCSYTSKDGQFLRIRRDKRIISPTTAIYKKVLESETDLKKIKLLFPEFKPRKKLLPRVYLADAKELSRLDFNNKPTAIITSPPYPNRYDYTRSYCLELCFHFVKNFKELKKIRFEVLRSHIESKIRSTEKPPHPAIEEVIKELKKKNLNNPRIPHMLIAYFRDMKKVIEEWSKILSKNAKVMMVIGNVRFEGELIPTDLILSEIAEDSGFKIKDIIIARYKGNSSQQMKKYGRIPVRESIVIWEK